MSFVFGRVLKFLVRRRGLPCIIAAGKAEARSLRSPRALPRGRRLKLKRRPVGWSEKGSHTIPEIMLSSPWAL